LPDRPLSLAASEAQAAIQRIWLLPPSIHGRDVHGPETHESLSEVQNESRSREAKASFHDR
jgi:hypothetical protein